MKYLGGLLLWLIFSLAGLWAIVRLLIAVIANNEAVWKPLGYSMDRTMAVLFGFSGKFTLSACLGTGDRYQWLRKIVDWFETGHCEKAARNEGLIN